MSDIEEESVSTHAAESTKESVGPSEDRLLILKNKRKQLRARITRAIKSKFANSLLNKPKQRDDLKRKSKNLERIFTWPVNYTPSFMILQTQVKFLDWMKNKIPLSMVRH